MDIDDILPDRPDDPLSLLIKQDLDPFSINELSARIEKLKLEISRCETKIKNATSHMADAEALFKK